MLDGSSWPMRGSATLTMVESRNTIPDARITAVRIQRVWTAVGAGIEGWYAGCRPPGGGGWTAAARSCTLAADGG